MLRTQRGICFKGGLESDLVDDHFVSNITSLRIKELWLACDTDARLPAFQKACDKLRRGRVFSRDKYTLLCPFVWERHGGRRGQSARSV